MKIEVKVCSDISSNEIIIPVFSDSNSQEEMQFGQVLNRLKEAGVFEGRLGESYHFNSIASGEVVRWFFIGLGSKDGDLESMRKAMGNGIRGFKAKPDVSLQLVPLGLQDWTDEKIEAMAEATIMTLYRFGKYKTKGASTQKIEFVIPVEENFSEAIWRGVNVGESVNTARSLTNEPPNKIYPESLAAFAQELGTQCGFEVIIRDEAWIEATGMGALYAVGKGGKNPSRLIEMKYMGDSNSHEWIGLVGKGVTFDSGGYNLKKSEGLQFMKSDMGGASAVLGMMQAVASNKLSRNIHAVIPSCENMIGSGAYKAGDVITTLAGKTVEVGNTDAEGRLAMADALYYLAQRDEVKTLIDIATLTGAAATTFGTLCSPILSNSEDLIATFKEIGDQVGERVWQLPMWPDYKRYLASDVADMNNSSMKKSAGTILGGLFVSEFVCGKPWIHIDIAGTNGSIMPNGYTVKGATGVGVRLLYEFMKKQEGRV